MNRSRETATQRRILAVLDAEQWLSPYEIARLVDPYANAGGMAKSLRVLLRFGEVEQRERGQQGRWTLYEYRRASVKGMR